MKKKVIEWKWDRKAKDILFEDLEYLVYEASKKVQDGRVLDVGGRGGRLGYETGFNFPVCIDIKPIDKYEKVNYIKGNILEMPFDDESFDLVIAKAVLHHIPDKLDHGIRELYRITKKNGILIVEEPTSSNILSNIAHKFFTTTCHDEGERPLDPEKLRYYLDNYYYINKIKPFFLFSYLLPHLVARVPGVLKNPIRDIVIKLYRLDKMILRKKDSLWDKCAYIGMIGTKE